MSNEWDGFAGEWDTNEDVRIYAEKAFDSWTKLAAPLVSNLPQCKVLDFGCGTGLLTEKIAPHCRQVVAVDTSPKMVDVLSKKIAGSYIDNIVVLNTAMNAETIKKHHPLLSKFDMVVASSVCSFLPDYEATLRDLTMVMNPGAYFVQWDWLADMPENKIRAAYKAAGLKEHSIRQVFSMDADEDPMPVVMGIGRLIP